MVSRIAKKSANRRRNRGKSSAKNAAAAASSAVLASLFTCQRRLIKLFTKLARIGTPTRAKGYKVLKKGPARDCGPEPPICRALCFDAPLPPPDSAEKRTVVLDLDETLVHSQADPPPEKFDFVVRPRIDGVILNFYVRKRPGVDEFLVKLAEKFEVVVFTAGLREYASLVLDRLDRTGAVSHRLYRDSCREVEGKFVKDLSGLGRDLGRVVIVDDNPNSYSLQPENAVPVRPFVDDVADGELGRLGEFFDGVSSCEDMRDAVKQLVAGGGGGGGSNGDRGSQA